MGTLCFPAYWVTDVKMISFGELILIQIKLLSHRNHQHQEVERSGAALLATKAGFAFGTSWAWIKVKASRLKKLMAHSQLMDLVLYSSVYG